MAESPTWAADSAHQFFQQNLHEGVLHETKLIGLEQPGFSSERRADHRVIWARDDECLMMKRIRMLATTGFVTASLQALALGAGQDASDCHHVNKAGLHHCQRAQRVRIELPPPAAPATTDAQGARTVSTAPQAVSPCRSHTTGSYAIASTGRINGLGC